MPADSRVCADDFGAVGFVLVDGLAGPQPGRQDAAGDAEVVPVVGLHPALAGDQAGAWRGRVGRRSGASSRTAASTAASAVRRAAGPGAARRPGRLAVGVGFADGFGEVLGEVADGLVGVLGDDALQVELRAEPHHMRRLGVRVGVEPVERLGPGRQDLAGVGVGVAVLGPGPLGQPVDVDGLVEGGPPQGVVGGGDDLAEDRAGDRAADGGVQMRRQPRVGLR